MWANIEPGDLLIFYDGAEFNGMDLFLSYGFTLIVMPEKGATGGTIRNYHAGSPMAELIAGATSSGPWSMKIIKARTRNEKV